MSSTCAQAGGFTLIACRGDAKTLLAFNLTKAKTLNLAGFTIQALPPGGSAYFLWNTLQFEQPSAHAQVATESPKSSVDTPFHNFRWVHVPGTAHQDTSPAFGSYTYMVTPRYFDDHQSMRPLDLAPSLSVTIDVSPFERGNLALGFTCGFVQTQGYVNHFGDKALTPRL
jgi:hypothetical protein